MENIVNHHIEMTSDVAGGKPHVAGHRITVHNVVIWHERLGMSADEIATEYGLTLAAVFAALTYYYDHRSEIDRDLQDDEGFIEQLRQCTPSKLKEKLGV